MLKQADVVAVKYNEIAVIQWEAWTEKDEKLGPRDGRKKPVFREIKEENFVSILEKLILKIAPQ